MWRRLFNVNKDRVGGVEILVTSNCNSQKIKMVYDTGNGPFVDGFTGGSVYYLKPDGTFEQLPQCGGDPQNWRNHVGKIVFK